MGYIPADLLITNIHGVGGARNIEGVLETIADYSMANALIVDREGDMAKYVDMLIREGTVRVDDVLMVDTSFEEANFTYGELVRVAKGLAANPPGARTAVRLRLTAKELRAKQSACVAAAKRGQESGLAETLLTMLRDHDPPVNLKKTELSRGLLDFVLAEIERQQQRGNLQAVVDQRRIVRFVAERVANPLANFTWR